MSSPLGFKPLKPDSYALESKPQYHSDLARDVAGVSQRQLQWWDEQGIVSPRMEGHKRVYTAEQVRLVRIVKGMREKGLSLHRIRKIIRHGVPARYVIVYVNRGRLSKWCETETEAIKAVLQADGAVFLIDTL